MRVCVWALAGLSTLGVARANPDTPSIELSWSGPSTEVACLGGEGLTRAVNEYLGRHAISSPPAELSLSVAVERLPKGWRALIKLRDHRTNDSLGERELTSDGPLCSGLDEPLKLAVALLVDSELVEAVSASKPAPPAPPPAPPEPPPEPEPEPRVEEPPQLFPARPWQFALDASVVGLSGVLPSLAAGVDFGLEASPTDWLAFRAHAVGVLPQVVTVSPGAGAEVNAAALYAGAALCPRAQASTQFVFLGCFGFEGGRLSVSRSGLADGNDAVRRLLMGSLGGRLSWVLSPKVSVVGHFSLLLPLRQDRFVVTLNGENTELFAVSAVPWVAGAGASFMF
ncbi:MAG: hypothetical protein QM756_47035 [Polyangiaceae bacterium]